VSRGATGLARLLFRKAKNAVFHLFSRVFPVRWKEFNELAYWERRKRIEGALSGDHFKYFYTAHFGLDDGFYQGKFIMDIGCGPRGSLEWASMASRRLFFSLQPAV
jgi:hypothetical protein